MKKLYDSMLQAAVGRSGDDAILALSEAYVEFARIHPGLYDATIRFPNGEDKELQQAQQSVVELVVQLLQAYDLQEEMAIHLVRGLRSILHGFTSIEKMGGFGMAIDIDRSFSLLLNTYIEGIHSIVINQLKYELMGG
ncbi:hypothetical protein SRABI96_03331 [Peribacillus sp. Bi96]|uniref:TetR-like C-terminal domain-containing protein n=1 Tax=unclassified Peribacillus TaxID=2675266 RepID=UPI001DE0C389|nr:hypothetical protein SRABI96_03331 [Peribacillus sp. Bi96]